MHLSAAMPSQGGSEQFDDPGNSEICGPTLAVVDTDHDSVHIVANVPTNRSTKKMASSIPRLELPSNPGNGNYQAANMNAASGNATWQRQWATPTPLHSPDTDRGSVMDRKGSEGSFGTGSHLQWRERVKHFTWTWFTVCMLVCLTRG